MTMRLATVTCFLLGTLAGLIPARLGRAGVQACCDQEAPFDPSADVPDPAHEDSNGDGIDGLRCGPVFVSPGGADSNPGTIDAPMRTIGAATLLARSLAPLRDVYVANGDYQETVVLEGGVNLYGGYDAAAGWARSDQGFARLRGGAIAWGQRIRRNSMKARTSRP
jgi:hypothetical protein